MNLRPLAPTLLACAALGLPACGSKHQAASSQSAASTPATTAAPATTTPPAGGASGKGANRDLSVKPKVAKVSGPIPHSLKIKDIVQGSGAAAQPGQMLTVQYVGVSAKTGKQFDASWDHGQPFAFQLGAGMVIPGWDKGLVGMRVGGRRELTIPPSLAYGAQGQPPTIKPNEPLVFVIDLLKAG